MQFVGFFLDPITLSIDTYNGDNVTELQPPIVLNSNAKDSLLLKIYKLQYVSGNSDKFGLALERAQMVKKKLFQSLKMFERN